MVAVTVLRSADRFVTPTAWGESRHCFSFGAHYDPENTSFGPLVACNEELLPPGAGFDEHDHAGVDVVTWVLEGELTHEDSTGGRGAVRPGTVQTMRTGRGITHAERNESPDRPVRFVQSWVLSRTPDAAPARETHEVGALGGRGLVPAATARGGEAELLVGRLAAGETALLPPAPLVHLLVARGAVDLAGTGRLDVGDSARLTAAGAVAVAGLDEPAELLVWAMSDPRS